MSSLLQGISFLKEGESKSDKKKQRKQDKVKQKTRRHEVSFGMMLIALQRNRKLMLSLGRTGSIRHWRSA